MFEKLYGILQQRAYIPDIVSWGKKESSRVVQDFRNTAFDCSGKGTKAEKHPESGPDKSVGWRERSGRLPVHEADKIFP